MFRFCQAAEPTVRAAYSFVELGQRSIGSFHYETRLLNHSDGALIGVCLRLSNVSETTALRVSVPVSRIPLVVLIESKYKELTLEKRLEAERAEKAEFGKYYVVHTLAPKAVENYFVAVRDVLPDGFSPAEDETYALTVLTLASPQDAEARRPTERHSEDARLAFKFFSAEKTKLTRSALAVDANAAYRDAMKTSK